MSLAVGADVYTLYNVVVFLENFQLLFTFLIMYLTLLWYYLSSVHWLPFLTATVTDWRAAVKSHRHYCRVLTDITKLGSFLVDVVMCFAVT